MFRSVLSLALALSFALPVDAGEYSNLAAGILAMYSKPVVPVPGPAPKPSSVCENCSGTGKLGDGTVSVTCPVCNGTGKTTTTSPEGCPCGDCDCGPNCPCPKFTAFDRRLTDLESAVIAKQEGIEAALKELSAKLTPQTTSLSPEAQPTPLPAIGAALKALNPKPEDTFVDLGAGHDARVLINAAKMYGVKNCIGVEIDPSTAESARRYVEHAGLSDRIKIVEGDAAKVETDANIGFAYQFTDTLGEMLPQIKKLDRFVSYMHPVPGLKMTNLGDGIYFYERPKAQSQMQLVQPTVAYWNGRAYSRANSGCNCAMCQSIRAQLAARYVPVQTETPIATQAASTSKSGRWVTVKQCSNGRCSFQKVWVEE